ncbi:MAG: hypothetical protein J0M33_23875 [Anaerolineae bacterium]|nr:hypothetical protein [Anaerolineae bacterium]
MQVEFVTADGLVCKIEVAPVTNTLGIWDTEIDYPVGRYRIVHIPTGKWITETYDDERARAIALELDKLGDWSQSEMAMDASGLYAKARMVVSSYPEAMGW